MAILAYMNEALEQGDPIVRKWPMVDSYYLPFLFSLLYVFFVKRLGPTLMVNRKPFDLRTVMIVYNFIIVFIYASSLLLLCYFFLTTDAYTKICSSTIVKPGHWTYYATSTGWILYMLKYVEYADTVFFVLRKKNHLVTNLHVIHHSFLPIIGWILLRTETSGFQFIPSAINSFVHVIMYTYYGLAAMGPEVQKHLWWKEHLTKLQMLQFIVILVFVLVIIPVSGCKTSTHGLYMDIMFALLFLGLFYNFYTKTYKSAPKINNAIDQEPGKHSNSNNNVSNGKVGSLDREEESNSKLNTFMDDFPVHGELRRR